MPGTNLGYSQRFLEYKAMNVKLDNCACVVYLIHVTLSWLYTFRISHFASVSRNTPQNTKHPLYIFRILCEFHVL